MEKSSNREGPWEADNCAKKQSREVIVIEHKTQSFLEGKAKDGFA